MNGSLHLITAPTEDVVTLDEAKAQLRQTGDTYDDMIGAMIVAAVAQIDPAGGGWLGRALRPQQWELRLDGFPCAYYGSGFDRNFHRSSAHVELPYPPLISIDSFIYHDAEGNEQALIEDTGFRILGGGKKNSVLAPLYNATWPTSRVDNESVRIKFTAGYATADLDPLPPPIKQAVHLAVRDLWAMAERNLYLRTENIVGVASYEWTVSESAGTVIRAASENLLRGLRVYE